MAYLIKQKWNSVSTNNIAEAFYYLEFYKLIKIDRIDDNNILVKIKGKSKFSDKKSTMSEVIINVFKNKPKLTDEESKGLLELAVSNDDSNCKIIETIVLNSNIVGNKIFKNKKLKDFYNTQLEHIDKFMYYLSTIKYDSGKSI